MSRRPANARHGPHQPAQKSTSTGTDAVRTRVSNWRTDWISAGADSIAVITDFLTAADPEGRVASWVAWARGAAAAGVKKPHEPWIR